MDRDASRPGHCPVLPPDGRHGVARASGAFRSLRGRVQARLDASGGGLGASRRPALAGEGGGAAVSLGGGGACAPGRYPGGCQWTFPAATRPGPQRPARARLAQA